MVLTLCNLLFPVRCWSENCHLVWNALRQGSKHNPTLHFQHLNLIWVNTKHHFALWTFKSCPGLFSAEHTPHCICLPFWGLWSLFCTLSQLEEGVVLPYGVVWGQSTPPPTIILWIRGTQGWDCLLSVHGLSVSLLFTVTFKYPFSFLRLLPKYLALRIQLLGTHVANSTCLQESNAYSKPHLVLYNLV
jgi:hypothetical protein